MSNGLQSLLGRSLTQSLGLGDILSKRESETQRLGELRELQGQAELERARGAGQASLVSEMGKQRRQTIREVDMPRDKMNLLLSLGGAAVGGIGLGMGLSGAKLGAQIGSSLSGSRAPGQMVVGGLGAVQELGAAAAEKEAAQEMADIKKRKLIAETGKIEVEALKTAAEIGVPKKTFAQQISQGFSQGVIGAEMEKTIIREQQKGSMLAADLSQEELDLLPTNAFKTIGIGDKAIKMVKSAKSSGEIGPKIAAMQIGAEGIGEILVGMDKDEFSRADFIAAASPAQKVIGVFKSEVQELHTKLNFWKETMARVFSGATVPETEQARFQEIFSILPGDSLDTIRFKLQRNMDMARKIESYAAYGNMITLGSGKYKGGEGLKQQFADEIIQAALKEQDITPGTYSFDEIKSMGVK